MSVEKSEQDSMLTELKALAKSNVSRRSVLAGAGAVVWFVLFMNVGLGIGMGLDITDGVGDCTCSCTGSDDLAI